MADAAVTTETVTLHLSVPGDLDEKAVGQVLATQSISVDEVKRVH